MTVKDLKAFLAEINDDTEIVYYGSHEEQWEPQIVFAKDTIWQFDKQTAKKVVQIHAGTLL